MKLVEEHPPIAVDISEICSGDNLGNSMPLEAILPLLYPLLRGKKIGPAASGSFTNTINLRNKSRKSRSEICSRVHSRILT